MEILDSVAVDDQNRIFAVALEPGFVVDVKVCAETDFVYVMQNEDGSTVYDQSFADYTFPGFEYDEEAVIQFVKKNSGFFDGKEKLPFFDDIDTSQEKCSLDYQIQSASTRATLRYPPNNAPAKEISSER